MTLPTDRAALLTRLEEIARELIAIRSALLADETAHARTDDLTESLLGCMGEEPLDRYDYSLEWLRFSR